jgi:hypothetical protein
MAHFAIQAPMWGDRYVGLADHKIEANNTIEILYTNKHGERTYPDKYSMTGAELRKYSTKQFKATMPLLRMVPITELRKEGRPDV